MAQVYFLPRYWWVYALLLSSMIPSLITHHRQDVVAAWYSRAAALLLRSMPEGKAPATFDRTWLALVLTSQIFVGAFLGIAAQGFLAWGVVFHLMPWAGLDLLDMARAVAAFDLPARAGRFFADFI